MNTTPQINTEKQTVIIACHAWFHEQIGGSFKIATEQAIDLANQGYRVCYVCSSNLPEANENKSHCYEEQGVEIWTYPAPKAKSPSVKNIFSHVNETKRLTQTICEQANVTAIIGHTPLQFRGAAKVARKFKINTTYSVHSPFDEELRSHWGGAKPNWKQNIAVRIAHFIESRNLKLADRIQTYSQFTQTLLIQSHGEKIKPKCHIAPGYVDCSLFQPSLNRQQERAEWGTPWDAKLPTFFTLRRLEPRMGVDSLIHAAGLLKKQNQDFRIIIGGAGSQRQSLENLTHELNVEQQVHFLGRLSDKDLRKAYAATDCFVLPTLSLECFGLIILEAFACNTPVIATSAGAIPELVNKQGDGWIVPPNSPEQLTEKMGNFINGSLKPTVNLREIALEYDKTICLKRLANVCLNHNT